MNAQARRPKAAVRTAATPIATSRLAMGLLANFQKRFAWP